MNVLADTLVLLDAARNETARFRRTDAKLTEAQLDDLVIRFRDVIAQALCSADVVRPGMELRVIGRQIENIDVLMAECDASGHLGRLVVVEDKLVRNPESRRKVFAQTLDYAHRLQYDLTSDDLIAKCANPETRKWLVDHQDHLDLSMQRGEFLLVICGDRIDPRLVDLAQPFLERRGDPLALYQLCLLSIALYEGPGGALALVPNVVGIVRESARSMTIQVVVEDREHKTVDATVRVLPADQAPAPARARTWNETDFLGQAAGGGEANVAGVRHALEAAAAPGLRLEWGRGSQLGAFVVRSGPGSIFYCTSTNGLQIYAKDLRARLGTAQTEQLLSELDAVLHTSLERNRPYPQFAATLIATALPAESFASWVVRTRDLLAAL